MEIRKEVRRQFLCPRKAKHGADKQMKEILSKSKNLFLYVPYAEMMKRFFVPNPQF